MVGTLNQSQGGVCRRVHGDVRTGAWSGVRRGAWRVRRGCMEGCAEGAWRGELRGVHRGLPLATINLVGDNREFEF